MRAEKNWPRSQAPTRFVWRHGKPVKLGKNEERAQIKRWAILRREQPLAD
jgi:hypothetical protein